MKQTAQAFAPGNISCIFSIYEQHDVQKTGSTGLGFTVSEGVTVSVEKSLQTDILFNAVSINFPTVRTLIQKLTSQPVTVTITSPLPLGGGFGLSGASALATAYALNELFALGKLPLDLAKIAHGAEVENKTGLGDVTNQYFGGILLKNKPSFTFVVQRLPLGTIPVYWRYFSQLATSSVLTNLFLREKIVSAAREGLDEVQRIVQEKEYIQLGDLLTIAKTFAQKSTLLRNEQVKETIAEVEMSGGHASMIMLGNAVISDVPFPQSQQLFLSQQPAYSIPQNG